MKHFDYVLFDSPPMGAVTDAAILGPQVDGVLLVVRAGTSTLHAVSGARKQMDSVSARLLGAILNDADLGRYAVATLIVQTVTVPKTPKPRSNAI